MELEQLQALVNVDYQKLKDGIIAEKEGAVGKKDYDLWTKQYEIEGHDVNQTSKRPDKPIATNEGATTSPVTRIAIPMQKKIVALAATFLCGNKVKIDAKPSADVETNLVNMIQKIWDDNKLDYESLTLCEIIFSQTEAAELWYSEKASPEYWNNTPIANAATRLRMMVLSKQNGDDMYPVFNAKGDMIAFGRGYSVKLNGETEEHFDIYTDKTTYLSVKSTAAGLSSTWEITAEVNNLGKIPVIYYSQPKPEWHDVQAIIDRHEKSISNHGDNNDYFGSPMIVVKGKILGFAKKGEAGKLLELEPGAEAAYLESKFAPESIKLEQANLRDLEHVMSDTPDISWDQVKGLGQISGVALELLFLGAHMKAAKKEAIIGKGFQRRLNLLKTAMTRVASSLSAGSAINIKPVFEYYLPKDDAAIIDMLNVATGGLATVSQKTAVSLNPLVADPSVELEDIKAEGLNNIQNDGL